jgi:hypothetical protein
MRCEGEDWIRVNQDSIQRQDSVNVVTNQSNQLRDDTLLKGLCPTE